MGEGLTCELVLAQREVLEARELPDRLGNGACGCENMCQRNVYDWSYAGAWRVDRSLTLELVVGEAKVL